MWGNGANHCTAEPPPTHNLTSCFSILSTQAQTSWAHTWVSLHWSSCFQPLLQHTWKFVTFGSPLLVTFLWNIWPFLSGSHHNNSVKCYKNQAVIYIQTPSPIPWTGFYCNFILFCGLKFFHVDYSPTLACTALPSGFISEDLHCGSLPAALVFIWQTSKRLQIRKR